MEDQRGLEDGQDPAGNDPGEGAPSGHGGDQDARRRRIAAWRASERTLCRMPGEFSMGERLTTLAADARAVYDTTEMPDFYGDGPVAELERRTADVLGFPAAAFFPTGTMAQQAAMRAWAGRTGNATVALHPLAHPEVHERRAFGTVSGLRTVHPTTEPRLPTAEEVRDFEEPFGTLMLELPLRDAGFVLPTWQELTDVVEAARERDAVVHFDGARLWECAVHFGRPLEEIARLADSVYVSYYKTLEGLSGAALVGPESLVDEARTWRHRYGGQLFQQYPAALSALVGLDRVLPKLPSYVAHARVVAEGLAEGFTKAGVPWFRINPQAPHTHQFHVWLPYEADALDDAGLGQSEETGVTLFRRWFPAPAGPPGLSYSELTVTEPGLEWSAEDVRDAVAEFVRRLG
ncbi:beta-eliminating lyase-related protein [Streptomyces sp. NPDC023838]|uniref:threonine aldolase family protein n=1 Tax=Streptomyces sp. NPDC023838 TaxID=3154325 RepID=UPI0034022BE2